MMMSIFNFKKMSTVWRPDVKNVTIFVSSLVCKVETDRNEDLNVDYTKFKYLRDQLPVYCGPPLSVFFFLSKDYSIVKKEILALEGVKMSIRVLSNMDEMVKKLPMNAFKGNPSEILRQFADSIVLNYKKAAFNRKFRAQLKEIATENYIRQYEQEFGCKPDSDLVYKVTFQSHNKRILC